MPKSKRSILAVLSDTHGNSKQGLLNPDVELYQLTPILDKEGRKQGDKEIPYNPPLSYPQELLWKDFTEDLDRVKKLAGPDPIDLLHLGENVHGTKGAVVSHRAGDDVEIAVSNLLPYLSLGGIRVCRIAKGTEWHEGSGSGAALQVARGLRDKTGANVKAFYHPLLKINGFTVDASHHGPTPGKRNWLKGNELGWYLLSLMQDELDAGRTPPDIVLRGHYHQFAMAVRQRINTLVYESRAIICPSYAFTDAYARKSAQSPSRITIGMVAIEINDGMHKVHDFRRTYDLRTEEVIQ